MPTISVETDKLSKKHIERFASLLGDKNLPVKELSGSAIDPYNTDIQVELEDGRKARYIFSHQNEEEYIQIGREKYEVSGNIDEIAETLANLIGKKSPFNGEEEKPKRRRKATSKAEEKPATAKKRTTTSRRKLNPAEVLPRSALNPNDEGA